jgi:hypothetical protein
MTTTTSVLVEVAPGRVIPADRLVGVAELAELFTRRKGEMRLPDPECFEITRQMVSTWASRARTTDFPTPVITHLSRGLLWDVEDFVDPSTDVLRWDGPPGRWALRRRREAS